MKMQFVTALAVSFALGVGIGKADDQPDAKVVLDKAMKAMNGEAKLAKLATATGKVKVSGLDGNQNLTVELDGMWQGMSQYRADVQVQDGGNNFVGVIVVNGDKGWFKKMDKSDPAPEGMAFFIQNFLYAARMPQMLPALRDKAFTLAPLGEVKIGTQAAMGLSVSHKDRKDVSLFFDKETGLPLKSEIRLELPKENKEVAVEYHYSEYKDFGGLRLPSKVAMKIEDKDFTVELREISPAEKADDGQFGEP